MTWDPLTMTWTLPDGSTVTVLEVSNLGVPEWCAAARRRYPGLLERRVMEYMAAPTRVASGRERLGE